MPRRKVSKEQLEMIKERSKGYEVAKRKASLERIAREMVASELSEDDIKREIGNGE